jgi:hypothetical protein
MFGMLAGPGFLVVVVLVLFILLLRARGAGNAAYHSGQKHFKEMGKCPNIGPRAVAHPQQLAVFDFDRAQPNATHFFGTWTAKDQLAHDAVNNGLQN